MNPSEQSLQLSEPAEYGVRRLDDDTVELCTGCGFDGRRYPAGAVVDTLGALKWQWHEILGGDEAIVRARPAEGTWCAVEYAAHTRDILAGLTFVVELFLDHDDPQLPARPAGPADEAAGDRCRGIDREVLAVEVGRNADELAKLVAGLTPTQLRRPGSVGDIDGNVLGVARHAVHDATHHVLDARRGFARILLREDP